MLNFHPSTGFGIDPVLGLIPKTKKTASFEAVFVPGAGVEPARFPTGV